MGLIMFYKFLDAGLRHPKIQWIRTLFKKPDSVYQNCIPVVGAWANRIVLEHNRGIDTLLYCPELDTDENTLPLVERLLPLANLALRISQKTMEWLVRNESRTPVLSVCTIQHIQIPQLLPREPSMIVVLDQLRMIGNIGCIIRSAPAAGADVVAYTNRVTRLNNPRLVTASHGAVLGMPLIDSDVETLGNVLKAMGYQIFLADANCGEPYDQATFSRRIAIVLGSERAGIDREWYRHSNTQITIPICGNANSLNVSAAGSVLLFAASKGIGLDKKGQTRS